MTEVDKNTEIRILVDGSGVDGTFKEGDDIKKEVRVTLGDFLNCLTKNAGNAQTIKPGVQDGSIDAGIDLKARSAVNPYAPTNEHPKLTEWSDSGQIFGPDIAKMVDKGMAGHALLRDIEGSTDTSGKNNNAGDQDDPIVKPISSALKNNRFSPGPSSPFVEGGNRPDVVAGAQGDFGVYNSTGADIKISDLSKVGMSLMLRAAGEIKAASEGDPTSGAAGAAALVPGKAQLAVVKIPVNDLLAITAFGAPAKIGLDIPTTGGGRSWGHLNTQLEPFDGFLPIGMTILGVALVIALRLVTKGLLLLLGLIVKPRADINFAPSRGPFIQGEFGRPDPPNRLISLRAIGIQPTDRDFLTAVNKGLDVFFKFDGRSFKSVLQNPGYYTVFVRNVIRSGNVIVNSITDVFTSNQNPLAAAQAFIGIIDVLKTSKIIAFLNILAILGDRALELEETGFDANQKRISMTEFLPENPATRPMKSRESRSSLALAWRNSSVPSKFLFPASALAASDLISSAGGSGRIDEAMAGLGSDVASLEEMNDAGNRIRPSVVAQMETDLDAEYVPFYFHDLRTNEIVAFHAFLDNLEDQYAPRWEETSAYGRVDDVYTYTSTKRTITLSFNVLATNKPDFDVMWWKINKLTSMVYPQWSEGRHVHDPFEDVSFVQPFSQIPTASPVIRLRIGDMIKSNFSRFSLGRLFGLGTNKAKNLVDDNDAPPLARAKLISIRKRMMTNPAVGDEKTDGFMVSETAILAPKLNPGYLEFKDSSIPLAARIFRNATGKRLISPAPMTVKIKKGPSTDTKFIQGYGEHRIAYYVVEVTGDFADADDLSGEFLVTHTDLHPDNKEIARQSRGLVFPPSSIPQFDFFNPDSNSVVRSFESTQGKGLAGVIKSYQLSELAATNVVWETSEHNSRAPKLVKINMTFDVIHDIAPGLDSNGFVRAISYPVGDVAARASGNPYVREGDSGEQKFAEAHAKAFTGARKGDKKS